MTHKTVSHNCPDITLFEKSNGVVYVIYVSIPKWGNLQTSYTNIMRVYVELSIAVKRQWQVEVAYTWAVIISAAGVIPHLLHDVLNRLDLLDMLYMTIQRCVILSTCNTVTKSLADIMIQHR